MAARQVGTKSADGGMAGAALAEAGPPRVVSGPPPPQTPKGEPAFPESSTAGPSLLHGSACGGGRGGGGPAGRRGAGVPSVAVPKSDELPSMHADNGGAVGCPSPALVSGALSSSSAMKRASACSADLRGGPAGIAAVARSPSCGSCGDGMIQRGPAGWQAARASSETSPTRGAGGRPGCGGVGLNCCWPRPSDDDFHAGCSPALEVPCPSEGATAMPLWHEGWPSTPCGLEGAVPIAPRAAASSGGLNSAHPERNLATGPPRRTAGAAGSGARPLARWARESPSTES